MSRTTLRKDQITPTREDPERAPAGNEAALETVAISASPTMIAAGSHPLSPPAFVPGGRLGQYELIRELGRGGMGTVYLARDVRLGRRVAVKLLGRRGASDTARFLAESRVTAQCNHENIVVIHDVGEHDHHPYMVLEYVAGQTLSAWLEERALSCGDGSPPIEPSLAASLMIPVVRALKYAHGMGIVHRDLKPANIMLSESGTIKVLDFGIATLLVNREWSHNEIAIPAIGEPGALIGTLPYMAPEQLEGTNLDHRVDIWAVGIMLYEMVTGSHPVLHGDVDPTRALLDVCSLDLPMPRVSDRRSDLGPLAGVIDRCLSKDRAHRPRDAHALMRELEAAVTHPAAPGLGAPGGRRRPAHLPHGDAVTSPAYVRRRLRLYEPRPGRPLG